MAEEALSKNYTSKIKIGGVVYNLKDTDARNLLATLNGANTVEGSVLNSIKSYAQNADYGDVTLGYALGQVEGKVATLRADKTVEGSVDYKVYHDALNAIYATTPAVTREATQEDVNAGTASQVGEIIVVTPAKVTTIAQAIEEAANSIGSLTVNGQAPTDGTMAIVINASHINREDGSTTIELSLQSLEERVNDTEDRLDVLEGTVTTEGSVLKKVKDTAKDATYTEATGAVGVEGEDGYIPAKPAQTIAQAIKANTNAIDAEVVRATAAEKGITNRLDILEGSVDTTGSVKNSIKTQAGDAVFKFTGSETTTTLAAAIQANADAIVANKTGSFKIVDSTNDIDLSDSGLGIIYLVKHDPTEPNADGKSVPVHYDEYIVIKVGDNYQFELLGDTEITLEGYATQNWVNANAKDGILVPAFERDPTEEEIEAGASADEKISVPAVTIAQAISALQDKVKEGTEALRADLNAEIERADAAEKALGTRIDNLDAETVKTINGIAVTTATNDVTIKAKDIVYKDAIEGTPEVTIKGALDSLRTDLTAETIRATAAEEQNANGIAKNAEDIADLQAKVKGTTVKSVNGVAATDENGGDISIDASIIDYKKATPGSGNTGDEDYVAPTEAVSIKAALDDHGSRIENIEGKTVTQTINGVESTVTGNFKDGISIETALDSHDIKIDKNVEGSKTIFEKLQQMTTNTAQALTSVEVRKGTGTWAVDADDNEMLDWTDIVLDTSDATFLIPSVE